MLIKLTFTPKQLRTQTFFLQSRFKLPLHRTSNDPFTSSTPKLLGDTHPPPQTHQHSAASTPLGSLLTSASLLCSPSLPNSHPSTSLSAKAPLLPQPSASSKPSPSCSLSLSRSSNNPMQRLSLLKGAGLKVPLRHHRLGIKEV